MFLFLVPLLAGFGFNSASTFTTYYSKRIGDRWGRLLCTTLRNVLGIPLWTIGYIMAARASAETLFNPAWLASTVGWLFILAGGSIIFMGILALRWRAAAPSMHDSLVSHGIYSHIRHPVYSGMLLQLSGLFLLLPTLPIFIATWLGMIWIAIQAALEEMDLVQRLPAYAEYMQQVPRFVPRLKARRGDE